MKKQIMNIRKLTYKLLIDCFAIIIFRPRNDHREFDNALIYFLLVVNYTNGKLLCSLLKDGKVVSLPGFYFSR
jgi:hypothetical protein